MVVHDRRGEGSTAELDLIGKLVPPAHHDMVRGMLVIPRVGFSSLKLENSFTSALGLAFNLESHGLNRSSRRAAVRRFAELAGNPEAGERILEVAESLQHALRLLHLPVGGLGVDVTARAVREIKSYLRMEWCDETIPGGDRKVCPTGRQDEMAAMDKAMKIAHPQDAERALTMLSVLQKTACTLEGLGVDIHGTHVETKLYFVGRMSDSTAARPFTPAETAESLEVALTACNLAHHLDRARELVRSMSALNLPCTQLSVELRPDDGYEVKAYYDTWDVTVSKPEPAVLKDVALSALQAIYVAAGKPVDATGGSRLLDKVYASGMMIDSFTTDFAAEKCGAKTYLRSSADVGFGVNLPAMEDA